MSFWNYLQPKVDVQLNIPQEKPRDIDSEIDWKIIDQLHNAVLNIVCRQRKSCLRCLESLWLQ